MSDGIEGAKGCAYLLFVLFCVLLVWGIADNINKSIFGDPEAERVAEQRRYREERQAIQKMADQKKETETAIEIAKFAQENIPQLNALLSEIEQELGKREASLQNLATVFRSVGREPSDDKDFKRWSDAIEGIKKSRQQLIDQRVEAFLAFKKAELAPTNTDRALSLIHISEPTRPY